MDFILKDIYNDQGVLVVKKGAVANDAMLIRLKAHGIKRLEYDEINKTSLAEPIAELLAEFPVKSDLLSLLDELSPTIYNRAKHTSVIARLIGEWMHIEGERLDNLTLLGTFYNTGISVDLRVDPAEYENILAVAYAYTDLRLNQNIHVLETLDRMMTEYLADLDPGILFLFLNKMADMLTGSVIEMKGKKYKIIYLSSTDFSHPIVQDIDTNSVKSVELS